MPVRRIRIALAAVAALAVAAIVVSPWQHSDNASDNNVDPHAPVHFSKAKLHSLLAATESATKSTPNAELVSQGHALFFSHDVARTGESCQSCHVGVGGVNAEIGTIQHPRPGNATDFTGARDPIALFGVGETAPYLWGGTVATLQQQTINVIKTFFKDGATQPDSTTGSQAAAIVAYMNTITPPVSPFDLGTMSDAAKAGESVFNGKGHCNTCHTGVLFTDLLQHDTKVPKPNGETDPGHGGNAFDTPQMRDVRNTAPYMHNGVEKTLEDVVNFYDTESSIAPLNLTPQQKSDLVEFMKAL
jgi:cytochrome c peroxidase